LSPGPEQEQEPIGALLARLVEDGRSLAKAELALFRTDFYRRIARARTGALLCLIGAIMGQAAAVTLLVTLSFVLTPWIGRIGASAVSVILGVGLAVVLIRTGVTRLMLVAEDFEDDDRDSLESMNPLEKLFDRMRERSREARNQLAETVDETQARLHPQALIADLADELVDYAQATSHRVIDTVRRRPVRVTMGLVAILLLVARRPIYRLMTGLGRATRSANTRFADKRAGRPVLSPDEETSS